MADGVKYSLSGFYTQGGARGELEGEAIAYLGGDNLVGKVTDKAAPEHIAEREIHGKIRVDEGDIVLEFLVKVPDDEYVNVRYAVRKKADGSFEGTYEGEWRFVEKTTSVRVTGRPYHLHNQELAYPSEVKRTVPRPGDGKPQPAEITLRKAA